MSNRLQVTLKISFMNFIGDSAMICFGSLFGAFAWNALIVS